MRVKEVKMPLVTIKNKPGSTSKNYPVRVTTMDAELEFDIDVSSLDSHFKCYTFKRVSFLKSLSVI